MIFIDISCYRCCDRIGGLGIMIRKEIIIIKVIIKEGVGVGKQR